MRISPKDWPRRVEARESCGRTGCFSVLGKIPVAKVWTRWSPVGGKGSSHESRHGKRRRGVWLLTIRMTQRSNLSVSDLFTAELKSSLHRMDWVIEHLCAACLLLQSSLWFYLNLRFGCFCLEVAKSSQNFRESSFKQVRRRQLRQEKSHFNVGQLFIHQTLVVENNNNNI